MNDVFTKYGEPEFEGADLAAEVEGLAALREAIKECGAEKLIRVPDVLSISNNSITLRRIHQNWSDEGSKKLGIGLAMIHKLKKEYYGWKVDNFIGLNRQQNCKTQDWGDFFIKQRLSYQIAMIENSRVRERFTAVLDANSTRLSKYLTSNCAHGSLLHGDLWSGNVMLSLEHSYLIDPSVYVGDREVDLAMTEVFGGFSGTFYAAYDETYPRTKEYDKKKIIYNLYHYLNHYNLFGSGYLSSCERAIDFIASGKY